MLLERFLRPCLRPLLAAVLAAAALAGCSSGPDPALVALRNTAPSEGMARLVVYYPGHFLTSGDLISVDLNGTAHCNLRSGSFIVREVPPGQQQLKFSFCSLSLTAPYQLDAVAGGKYYVRVTPYDSSLTGILSGYPSEGSPYNPTHVGTFEVRLMKEQEALPELEGLTKVQN